jgi:pimeloyl-ACP methyl ester carboxylesterase
MKRVSTYLAITFILTSTFVLTSLTLGACAGDGVTHSRTTEPDSGADFAPNIIDADVLPSRTWDGQVGSDLGTATGDSRPQPIKAHRLSQPSNGFDLDTAKMMTALSHAAYSELASAKTVFDAAGLQHFQRIEKNGFRVDALVVPKTSGAPVYVFAFRGTELNENIYTSVTNVVVDLWAISPGPLTGTHQINGRVHKGFDKAFNNLWQDGIKDLVLQNPKARFWITGHSLGGALATMAAARISDASRVVAVYTFGAPRIGDQAFRASYDGLYGNNHFRVVYASDAVVHLPPRYSYERKALGVEFLLSMMKDTLQKYRHVGQFCWFDRKNDLQGNQCEAAGSDAGKHETSWQKDMQNVVDDAGYVNGLTQMTQEHTSYEAMMNAASL